MRSYYILYRLKVIDVAVPKDGLIVPLGAAVTVTFESAPAAASVLLGRPGMNPMPDNNDGYAVHDPASS